MVQNLGDDTINSIVLPNYNLLKYELSDSTLNIRQINKFYRTLCLKYSNNKQELYDWFGTFSKRQLIDIRIKHKNSGLWLCYQLIDLSRSDYDTIVAKSVHDESYWLMSDEDEIIN